MPLFPNNSLPSRAWNCCRERDWGRGESDEAAGLGQAGLGWADPSPERGGTPGGGRDQGRWRGPDTGEAIWQEPASEPASTGRSRDIPGWDRKNNPEPWNRLSPNDQYKFLAVSTDYKKLKKDRPDF
ncbi:NADH dehydrogenase [ubiquinone] 1 alpha subcomplex subunit 4-like 2 isoform X1 [Balaenoptera musculus]|uniref:NADH dehydrogenase [ubiquinone] 1 alpha subcomplex subunit 4-like 2 isoform X1 n=1 Tax=Balaenoptera musculus TaxID=9771 RepID=A0A8B8YPX4_BALMU|nr:NADH dehydrogenase [ubiquinone] 1 alpha subcomplex subunit 4-like 2 isoform X1 [Balaenoptera musculus]